MKCGRPYTCSAEAYVINGSINPRFAFTFLYHPSLMNVIYSIHMTIACAFIIWMLMVYNSFIPVGGLFCLLTAGILTHPWSSSLEAYLNLQFG